MYWICGTSTVLNLLDGRHLSLHDHRHIHNSVDELHLRDFHSLLHSLNLRDLSLHHNRHINNLVDVLNLRNLDLLGHLVDLLLDDGFLSLHGLLDDSGLLHFDRVHDLLCDFRDLDDLLLRLDFGHLDDLLSERNSRGFDDLLHNTLLNPVLGENLRHFHQPH